MDAFERLLGILRKVFNDDAMVFARETAMKDVDGWDSFAQMQILTQAESEFGIKFSLREMLEFKNVGDLADCISGKLGEAD